MAVVLSKKEGRQMMIKGENIQVFAIENMRSMQSFRIKRKLENKDILGRH